jgi:hypothetical protein
MKDPAVVANLIWDKLIAMVLIFPLYPTDIPILLD